MSCAHRQRDASLGIEVGTRVHRSLLPWPRHESTRRSRPAASGPPRWPRAFRAFRHELAKGAPQPRSCWDCCSAYRGDHRAAPLGSEPGWASDGPRYELERRERELTDGRWLPRLRSAPVAASLPAAFCWDPSRFRDASLAVWGTEFADDSPRGWIGLPRRRGLLRRSR